jgi:GNAT superfamily N-acetyltransferase
VKVAGKLTRNDLVFQHRLTDSTHRLEAYLNDECVGRFVWSRRSGKLIDVMVVARHRRRGVATILLYEARALAERTRGVKKPRHSDDRTDLGELWARSLGERLPRRTNYDDRT